MNLLLKDDLRVDSFINTVELFDKNRHLQKVSQNFISNSNLKFEKKVSENDKRINKQKGFDEFRDFFKFDRWKGFSFVDQKPARERFQSLSPTLKNIELVKESAKNLDKGDSGSTIFTFQNKDVIDFICQVFDKSFDSLPIIQRDLIWSMLIGCKDFIDQEALKKTKVTQFSRDIDDYLKKECELGRIIELKSRPSHDFIACSVFSILESKFEAGVYYEKVRYVNNNVLSNECLLPIAENLSYTFPTAESIFRIEFLFDKLWNSKRLTKLDRSDYFRLWFTHPSAWPLAIIANKGDKGATSFFLDIRGRMGHTYASAYSQGFSFLADLCFNDHSSTSDPFSVTLQDDTLILQSNAESYEKASKINSNFGFALNHRKSEINQIKVKWSGYHFNAQRKILTLPMTKIDKLRTQIEAILQSDSSTRRAYCSILSKFYSARLIIGGNGQNLSSILFLTRKHCRCDSKWFYTEKILAEEYYNELVKKPESFDIRLELALAISLLASEACFQKIRDNIDFITEPVPHKDDPRVYIDMTRDVLVFSDAAAVGLGGWIYCPWLDISFAYSETFSVELQAESINFKELYALAKMLHLTHLILWQRFTKSSEQKIRIITCVDNETARAIAVKQRVNLKSVMIAKVAKFLTSLSLISSFDHHYLRISSEENGVADFLSRSGVNYYKGIRLAALDTFING